MRMSDDPAKGVTNDFGRIHDTTNCYVVGPALLPATGSPNPMLTGAWRWRPELLPCSLTRSCKSRFPSMWRRLGSLSSRERGVFQSLGSRKPEQLKWFRAHKRRDRNLWDKRLR